MNVFDYLFRNSKDLDKDLVSGPKETAGYREVYEDSLKISAYLRNECGENQNIILISDNSVFFIKVYLGILKSGNTCVPLSPGIEQSNFDLILKTTSCRHVFHKACPNLQFGGSLRLWGAQEVEQIAGKDNLPPADAGNDSFDPSRTAGIIFTSGSTGTPKGVVLSHSNIQANTESIVTYLALTSGDIIDVVLPFYYCYGLSLLHTHLRAGGSMVLTNFMFLGSVIDDLRNYRCTGFAGVPSHYQILLRRCPSFKVTNFPDLRYVTQAGGKLHQVFIDEFTQAFPNVDFFVMYGQTEATARLAYLPPADLPEKPGSIGKNIPGVTLKILTENGTPAAVGEVGEIVASGENIMQGYFNDPEATREAIIDGWLHTGDLGKTDADGFIYVVGRKKEIIKVGGQKVSPREIEEVILSVPDVVDCTVEGIYDELLGEAIKARVVLKDHAGKTDMRNEILNICRKKLSLFKIPQIIGFEESMDISSTGKKLKEQRLFKNGL